GLEEFASGVVRPHERTFPGPKADQLALLRATGAYLSPIFGLYARPGERLRDVAGIAGAPLVELTEEHGEAHRLWRVTDALAVARVGAALAAAAPLLARRPPPRGAGPRSRRGAGRGGPAVDPRFHPQQGGAGARGAPAAPPGAPAAATPGGRSRGEPPAVLRGRAAAAARPSPGRRARR